MLSSLCEHIMTPSFGTDIYTWPAIYCRFNARHRLQAAMEKTTNASNLGVVDSDPVTFSIPVTPALVQKDKSAPKPGSAGTVVFSHSVVESDNGRALSTGGSISEDSRPMRERRDGDDCV